MSAESGPTALSKAPPVALVIFGASGDLTHRKILPALARLADRGVLDSRSPAITKSCG